MRIGTSTGRGLRGLRKDAAKEKKQKPSKPYNQGNIAKTQNDGRGRIGKWEKTRPPSWGDCSTAPMG